MSLGETKLASLGPPRNATVSIQRASTAALPVRKQKARGRGYFLAATPLLGHPQRNPS